MFKPLLAEKINIEDVKFPVYASPKIDGFRCLIDPYRGPVTRSLKPIKNNYVRGKLAELKLDYLDGELVTFTGNKIDDFNTVQSKLSTMKGMPDFRLYAFDHFQHPSEPFSTRFTRVYGDGHHRVYVLEHELVHTADRLAEIEKENVDDHGWEGTMLRDPDGRYKFGRSTANEGILLKLKRFIDDEGTVVGATELRHNANEAVTNELGHTERSSHKENMVGMNVLGSLIVKWRDVEFEIGTGFDMSQRMAYWKQHHEGSLVGQSVQFKYQGVFPSGKPRFPVFRGFRYDL